MDKQRRKQQEKIKKGIGRQIQKHRYKLENEKGRKDTTPGYWRGEIERMKEKIRKIDEKLNEN